MGLFSRRSKSGSRNSSPALSISDTTIVPTPPPVPFFQMEDVPPRLTIRVALDPPRPTSSDTNDNGLFSISLDPRNDISTLRQAIIAQIGEASISLFKVAIPWQAQIQAMIYTEAYGTPVNLVTAFSSFNLDDPSQLQASLGPLGWMMNPIASAQTIGDWFPEGTTSTENISILVRTTPGPSNSIPLTLLAHFASAEASSSRTRAGSSIPRPPVVVDIDPSATVEQLKAAVIRVDGRECKGSNLEGVVAWKVDMSQEEMIVIGERGGLKGGRMPWPYPPTAPVPEALEEDTLSLSHYFPSAYSNARMISLSIWVDPSSSFAPQSTNPPYKYSVSLSSPDMTPTSTFARPSPHLLTPQPIPTPTFETFEMDLTPDISSRSINTFPPTRTGRRTTRARPSTAPASTPSTSDPAPRAPAFGSRSSRPLVASPLAVRPPISRGNSAVAGLGIGLPTIHSDLHAESIEQDNPRGLSSSSGDNSEDEGSLPSLNFSQLSLATPEVITPVSTGESGGIKTPDVEKTQFDWIPETKEGGVKKSGSMRTGLGGLLRRGGMKIDARGSA